jgi:hypothetical protein
VVLRGGRTQILFVDIEIEAGIAMPLIDGDGPRFFASTL